MQVQVTTQALQPRADAGMDFRCAPLGARAAAPLCKASRAATAGHQLRPARSEAFNYSGPLPSVSPDGQYMAAAEGDRVVVRAVDL